MTPKKNERDARGHRRSGPAANDGDKRADSTNDQQFAASADDVEDMDEEQSEDELLAAALFAEDALSDEMLVGTAEDLVDDELDDLRALDSLEKLGHVPLADPVAAARARLSVDELLARLVGSADEVALADLYVLSDISRVEADAVDARWEEIPVARRRRVVRELVAGADDIIELLLGRLLRIALRDSDTAVRQLAIEGLWEDDDPALIGQYVQLLNNDPDTIVRAAAASALGPFVLAGELDELDAAMAMRAEEALLAVVHNSSEPVEVQARALESVAYSGEAGLRQLIEDAYYAPEEEMRLSALRAMGRSADTRWRSMVRAELTSPDAAMRVEAALAAGELEIKAVTPQIIMMLADEELAVRLAAIEALGHLGGKRARTALRTMANEGSDEEVEAAEIALEEMLFDDVDPVLTAEEEDAALEEADDHDPDSQGYGGAGDDEYEDDPDDDLDDDADDDADDWDA